MIDDKTKEKLLEEIRKVGNVCLSCLKLGVNKATYYRWKKSDRKFSKEAKEAEKMGRENFVDIAEHGLLQNIRKGNQRAIEFALTHNSKRYKQKPGSTVNFIHVKKGDIPNNTVPTLEDLIDKHREQYEQQQESIDTGDSEFEKGMPAIEPPEIQTPQDNPRSGPAMLNIPEDNNT